MIGHGMIDHGMIDHGMVDHGMIDHEMIDDDLCNRKTPGLAVFRCPPEVRRVGLP